MSLVLLIPAAGLLLISSLGHQWGPLEFMRLALCLVVVALIMERIPPRSTP